MSTRAEALRALIEEEIREHDGGPNAEYCWWCGIDVNGKYAAPQPHDRNCWRVRVEALLTASEERPEMMGGTTHEAGTDPNCPLCINPVAPPAVSGERLREIAQEFITYYKRGGGCSNCGGLPHATGCFVDEFEKALIHDALAAPAPPVPFSVYQCEEWQCRHVFTDGRCCALPKDHDGVHAPRSENEPSEILAWLNIEQKRAERWFRATSGANRFALTLPELARIRIALEIAARREAAPPVRCPMCTGVPDGAFPNRVCSQCGRPKRAPSPPAPQE